MTAVGASNPILGGFFRGGQIAVSERFEEQCLLMDKGNLQFLSSIKRSPSGSGYPNFARFYTEPAADTSAFFNRLSSPVGVQEFLNISPAKASSLVPKIRIYKVYYEKQESKGVDYELLFDNYITQNSIEAIMKDRTGRGGGSGVKSFSWENKGENTALANVIFEANLTLFFQDINAMTEERFATSTDGKLKRRFSFLDLVVPQTKWSGDNTNNRVWNDQYFQIKISVGWSIPSKKVQDSQGISFSPAEVDAINKAGRTFFLNLIQHDISFDDTGQITLSIDYQANAENSISSTKSDVLNLLDPQELERLQELEKQLETMRNDKRSVSGGGCGDLDQAGKERLEGNIDDSIKLKIKEIEQEKTIIAITRYEKFIGRLFTNGSIRYVDVDKKQLQNYVASIGDEENQANPDVGFPKLSDSISVGNNGIAVIPTVTGVPDLVNNFTEKIEEATRDSIDDETGRIDSSAAAERLTDLATGAVDEGKQRILFMYMGDIINLALEALSNGPSQLQVRTIVGMTEIYDPVSDSKLLINVADIPVSFKTFAPWFFKQCADKELRSWRLKKFLVSLSQTLFRAVKKANCFDKERLSDIGDTDLKIELISSPVSDGRDIILGLPATGDNVREEVLTFHTARNGYEIATLPKEDDGVDYTNANVVPVLLMYGKHTRPERFHYTSGENRESKDSADRVYHLRVGRNRGVVKNINFSRVDRPFAKEARIVTSLSENDPVLAVRELYDVNITTIGNTIWYPGALLYVDLAAWFGGRLRDTEDQGNPPPGERSSNKNLATQMGLQGYYRIISTSSSIEDGKYELTMVGKYEFSGDKKTDDIGKPGSEENACPDEDKYPEVNTATAAPGSNAVRAVSTGGALDPNTLKPIGFGPKV